MGILGSASPVSAGLASSQGLQEAFNPGAGGLRPTPLALLALAGGVEGRQEGCQAPGGITAAPHLWLLGQPGTLLAE